jgi:hypothetical protein
MSYSDFWKGAGWIIPEMKSGFSQNAGIFLTQPVFTPWE